MIKQEPFSIISRTLMLHTFKRLGCSSSCHRITRPYFRAFSIATGSPPPPLSPLHKLDSNEHNPPLLMLPEPDNEASMCRRFYSISQRKVVSHIELPFQSNKYSVATKQLLSSYGWLLSISDGGENLSLVNPFSGRVIEMPSIPYGRVGLGLFQKFVLSANPSITSDFTAVVFLEEPYQILLPWHCIVASWKNGDDKWKMIDSDQVYYGGSNGCDDVAFYRGDFYSVLMYGIVVKFDFDSGELLEVATQEGLSNCFKDLKYKFDKSYYLVDCGGRLLLICRVIKHQDNASPAATTLFRIYEVDVENGVLMEVQSLENRAIFIGLSSSFSIKASRLHGIKPNSVYYTDALSITFFSCWKSRSNGDTGMYNMKDGSIEHFIYGPLRKQKRVSRLTKHMWVEYNPDDLISSNQQGKS